MPGVSDKQEIDELVAAFFASFTTEAARRDRLHGLRRLFLSEAVIVKAGAPRAEVMSLDAFLEPRVRLLAEGTLTDFVEYELTERTEVVGGIAQRTSTYAKSGVLAGTPFAARGVKLMQLVKTTAGWRLSALAWQDEPES